MKKSTRILALVWVLVLLASPLYAGHSFSDPMYTTGDGDLYVSGGLDVDGTCRLDGAFTFNAGATGDNLTLSGTLAVGGAMSLTDSLYVSGNVVLGDSLYVTDDLTVGDDFKVAGDLGGGRVWVNMAISGSNLTVDSGFGGTRNTSLGTTAGVPVTADGCVKGYAVRYNIDSFSAGAYAVTRFYIDGVKTFADSFYVDATGMQERTGTFSRDTHTFTAGEQLFAHFDINGTVQYDGPYLTWDLQLDD